MILNTLSSHPLLYFEWESVAKKTMCLTNSIFIIIIIIIIFIVIIRGLFVYIIIIINNNNMQKIVLKLLR